MLSKKDLCELIETAHQHINLRETIIEKDYYVTQVIHMLSNLEDENFRLIFCGGTCLAKAHKLVKRMSEDVDFKVQLKLNENFSKSRLQKELKKFREKIRETLKMSDLLVVDDIARNEGKYQQINLRYPYSFPVSSTLRPDVKVEFTYANILLSIDELQVKTLIEDILEEVTLFVPPLTKCITIDETAIEKWVGLTRRIMAIERGYENDDKTLIRHVYDLNAINVANKVNTNFIEHFKTVVTNDGKQFNNQHPEYANNPGAEIRQSLVLLKSKPLWKERYEEFLEVMVYDNTETTSYDQAIDSLEYISSQVINGL